MAKNIILKVKGRSDGQLVDHPASLSKKYLGVANGIQIKGK